MTEPALDHKLEKWRLNAQSMQAQETDSACCGSECAWHQGLLQLQEEAVVTDIPQHSRWCLVAHETCPRVRGPWLSRAAWVGVKLVPKFARTEGDT